MLRFLRTQLEKWLPDSGLDGETQATITAAWGEGDKKASPALDAALDSLGAAVAKSDLAAKTILVQKVQALREANAELCGLQPADGIPFP